MTREESTKIVDKIKIYRQSFLAIKEVYQEWFRILEPYDYEDVNQKLDDYFKNSDNFGKYPDAYYLTKYIRTHEEKLKSSDYYVRCPNCQSKVELNDFDNHYERCNSIEYLCTMSEKYYQKKLSREKMFKASKLEFEKYYWSFCEKLIDIMSEGLQKHILKNAILTHYGHTPELSLEECLNIKNEGCEL